jgi:hypothetical protein
MDNECVMNLYDNELDGMKFWITYGYNGQIMLLYNSCLDINESVSQQIVGLMRLYNNVMDG